MGTNNNPPEGWNKNNFDEKIAELTQELTEAKVIAEGRAAYLQQLFKATPQKLASVSAKYDEAAAKYNGVCAYLEVILSENQRPSSPPKLDEAKAAYKAFVEEAASLTGQSASDHALRARQLVLSTDPFADVFAGVDVILKGIEWFKDRHEKERLRIVDALKRTEWSSWSSAGSAARASDK